MTVKEKIILIIATLVLLFAGFGVWHYKTELTKQYKLSAAYSDSTNNVLKLRTDENGKLHGQVATYEIERKVFIATHQAYVDSIAKQAGFKVRNLTSITTTGTSTSQHIHMPIDDTYNVINIPSDTGVVHDTIKSTAFKYDDRWLTMTGTLDSCSVSIDYVLRDSLTLTGGMKGTGFLGLGKKKAYVDIKSENPHTQITSLKTVDLKDIKVKPWSVGPYVGYDFINLKPSIGISIQYKLLQF